ncbi:MAG TPA: helix-turn-helix transcriptional regulator [Azospirillum sp.]|nr:helix-turn-helix transcriptional regulator [Azospirillum sp.]
MTISWPSLLRTARRLVRLTQEDFAADLGRSQSMVALWEAGRRPIPPAVRRRVLDILAGYYRRRPEYETLVAHAATSPNPVTLYRQGMFVQSANPTMSAVWRCHQVDLVGNCILPLYRSELRVSEMLEQHVMPMLNGTSEVLSIAFNDRSVLMPQLLFRRTATVCRLGEGRLLIFEDRFVGSDPNPGLPPADLRILTADDVAAD